MVSSGGAPDIGSPDQAIVAIVLLAIVAVVWFLKSAD